MNQKISQSSEPDFSAFVGHKPRVREPPDGGMDLRSTHPEILGQSGIGHIVTSSGGSELESYNYILWFNWHIDT